MEDWEKDERRWRIIRYVVGLLACAAIMFILLMLVVRCCRGMAQDPFSVICERLMVDAKQERGK